MEALERVQKRLTRMLPGVEGMSYKERLDKPGLFSLERWGLRGALIEVYKIMRGIDRVDSHFPELKYLTLGACTSAERGKVQRRCEGQVFYTETGRCLERAARGGGADRYNRDV